MYGATKLISVNVKEKKFRTALTKYASLIEKTQVPEVATVITCLHTGVGRFGFDAINYHFWKEGDEFVFYPVRPEFKTAKAYNLVEAVRLNTQMVRSFYVTGEQFFEVKPAPFKEVPDNDEQSDTPSKPIPPVYRDTRATIIAYAVGDQTVYLTFSLNLNDRLKELLPDKEKAVIEMAAKQALADSLLPIVGTPPVETAMEKIADLQLLRDNGTITEEEFQERKNKLLDQQ
jgi:hypothetical protein